MDTHAYSHIQAYIETGDPMQEFFAVKSWKKLRLYWSEDSNKMYQILLNNKNNNNSKASKWLK